MAKAMNRNKYSRVGLHSERDNWLLTGAFADSIELLHTFEQVPTSLKR